MSRAARDGPPPPEDLLRLPGRSDPVLVAQGIPPHPAGHAPSAAVSGREADDRLRAIHAEQTRAPASLKAAQEEEVAVLAELHALGKSWFKIASYAPMERRRREAQRIRALVCRHRRVTDRHGFARAGRGKVGEQASLPPPSDCAATQKENSTMPSPRLIKRTVTEELYEDPACPLPDIDDDDNDAIAGDDSDDLIEAPRAARDKPQHSPGVSAAEAEGADDAELTGEEDL